MHAKFSLSSIFTEIGASAGAVLDTVADLFSGTAETLRDGTEHLAVELPRDLAAHSSAQTEWWYYTGHFETPDARKFGFELVFFKRRTDLDRFSVVPLRLLGNPFYFAHFAISDHSARKFRYAHRKSANGPLDLPASASEEHYHCRVGDWSVREAAGGHVLRATMNGDVVFEATLVPRKEPIFNGDGGVSFKDEGEASRYFSYTCMDLEGDLTVDGKTSHIVGQSWMDREFGTWTPTENQKGWDWFSIQLDNGTELMCYQLRNGKGERSRFSSGTFIDQSGSVTPLVAADFDVAATGEWTSPRSGATYPMGWEITVPKLGLALSVLPVFDDQELDTRGSTMIVYWEGSCTVRGTYDSDEIGGQAYAELVGYDRSHDQPNLASFLIGPSLNSIKDYLPKF